MITILLMCGLGASLKEAGITEEELLNLSPNYDHSNISFLERGENQNLTFAPRLIYKYADFLAYAIFEGSKQSQKYGYENPQYNYELAYKLVFLSCFAFLIIPVLFVLIFTGYFGILIWNKSKNLIIKWRQEHG